jgi:hypothetical protein
LTFRFKAEGSNTKFTLNRIVLVRVKSWINGCAEGFYRAAASAAQVPLVITVLQTEPPRTRLK